MYSIQEMLFPRKGNNNYIYTGIYIYIYIYIYMIIYIKVNTQGKDQLLLLGEVDPLHVDVCRW